MPIKGLSLRLSHSLEPMSTATDAIAEHALALRGVRRTYARHIGKHARAILKAALALRAIEADMDKKARLIAGNDYRDTYTISFDMHGSIDNQLENIGEVEYGAGIEDIITKAKEMVGEADEVAASAGQDQTRGSS
jgi:hypothetical protein